MKKLLPALFLTLFVAVASSGQSVSGCPTVEVVGPAGATEAGDAMFFSAKVSGADADKVKSFQWTISAGTITDGQGTDQIRVDTTADQAGSNITATVSINGLKEFCVPTASETAPIMQVVYGCPLDEFGEAAWADEQARLDNFLVATRNNPKSHAFIRMAVPAKETIENTKKHIINVLKHFRWRDPDFDLDRLNFAVKNAEESRITTFYLVPDGAKSPECAEGCTLINGKHLYF